MKRDSNIVDVWDIAWTQQTTEWFVLKQCLDVFGLEGWINVIKQLDININLYKFRQT